MVLRIISANYIGSVSCLLTQNHMVQKFILRVSGVGGEWVGHDDTIWKGT